MNRLLYAITGRLPCRIIAEEGRFYLERYYVATLLGHCIYLHRFVDDDPDRGLHDHPWPWAFSLILSGFYYEETRQGIKPVRWFNGLVGDSFHRVLLPSTDPLGTGPGRPCWSLFVHRAAYVKPWGFLRYFASVGYSTWLPWNYPDGDGRGKSGQWWKTAPLGRFEPRRAPLEGLKP